MGAGGLREPRRKGARVTASSGCIVPWAARASCWLQPQQLLPVSAAGSGRRCCCSNPPLRPFCETDKNRNSSTRFGYWSSWWARVDYASRAEKEPGSRLPAAASCLGRHAHPAGRSPNSSSLFLPLAAVVAVAVRIHPLYESSLVTKQKPQRICIR